MKLTPQMSNELRSMVRDALREIMAQRGGAPVPAGRAEAVRLKNDNDLAAFVARITAPGTLEQVRSGALRFTLGEVPGAAPAASHSAAAAESHSAVTGVVTEQKIEQFKGLGSVTLAPGAVITPLARDKARKLGITIERRR